MLSKDDTNQREYQAKLHALADMLSKLSTKNDKVATMLISDEACDYPHAHLDMMHYICVTLQKYFGVE